MFEIWGQALKRERHDQVWVCFHLGFLNSFIFMSSKRPGRKEFSAKYLPLEGGIAHCKYLRPNYDGITVYHRTSTIFRCNVPLQLNIPIATIRYTKIYSDMIVKCQ